MSKQRISWIDIAKSIGIAAIVLGHCSFGNLQCICFSFNSIIFFTLAGMTFCRKREETDAYLSFDSGRTLKVFLRDLFQTLGIPYLFWGIVSILIYALMGRLTVNALNMDQSHFEIGSNVISLIYGNSDTGYFEWNRPLWFLPCLFLVELLWFFILTASQRFCKTRKQLWIVYASVMVLSAANMFFISYSKHKFILPFEMETAISMMFFFGVGLLCRNEKFLGLIHKYLLSGKKALQYFYFAGGTGLAIVLSVANGLTDTRSDAYSNVFLYIWNALCASFAVIFISRIINGNNILEYIGQRTMAILVMHKFPIMFIRVFFPFLDKKISEGNIICEIMIGMFTIGSCLAVEKIIRMIAPEVFGKGRRRSLKAILSK